MIPCPRCGHNNPLSAQFCLQCHFILIHRCPKCWNEQRSGPVCDKCGTNFALFWELAFERSVEEENRLWSDRLKAALTTYVLVLLLPFTSPVGLLRSLALRLFSVRVSRH
jgi:hypothetical protein